MTKRKFIEECNRHHVGTWWALENSMIAKALKTGEDEKVKRLLSEMGREQIRGQGEELNFD